MISRSDHFIKRYADAHRIQFQNEYPHAFRDGHYSPPLVPKWKTSNGLTRFVVNFLMWTGSYGNRINTMGRMMPGSITTESGTRLKTRKFMPSTTKKGTADIHAIIAGRHVSIEIKIGADHQSDNQVKEQARIERAGGIYWIIKTPEQFFELYDSLKK